MAEDFKKIVPVLVVVIAVLLVIIAILVVIIVKLKKKVYTALATVVAL